jgi:hypothetical protein
MKETMKTQRIRQGHKTVGTSAVQLTTVSVEMEKGLLLRAPGSTDPVPNTAPIWVGINEGVTADSNQGSGGMPLVPGASITIPASLANDLWVISTAVSQDIAWMGV